MLFPAATFVLFKSSFYLVRMETVLFVWFLFATPLFWADDRNVTLVPNAAELFTYYIHMLIKVVISLQWPV